VVKLKLALRSSLMKSVDSTALSGFARKMAELVTDLADVVRNLIKDVRDSYRRELCYVRGPGAKWRARHRRR
jgi:hypothetical protein